MTNKEKIEYLKWIRPKNPYSLDRINIQISIDEAIKSIEIVDKVKNIVEHWNDESSTFVSACEAFEEILDIFKEGRE